jgi:hypothetical protein
MSRKGQKLPPQQIEGESRKKKWICIFAAVIDRHYISAFPLFSFSL